MVPVFRLPNGFQRSPQQSNIVAVQNTGVGQIHCQVEAGLSAQGRQYPVRSFLRDDAFEHRNRERFDIHPVCDFPVGHDSGRVGINQDRDHSLFSKRLTCLSASVIKLGSLADDNRARTYNQDFQCFAGGCGQLISLRLCRRYYWICVVYHL